MQNLKGKLKRWQMEQVKSPEESAALKRRRASMKANAVRRANVAVRKAEQALSEQYRSTRDAYFASLYGSVR